MSEQIFNSYDEAHKYRMTKISKTKEYAVKYLSDCGKKTPAEISTELKIPLDEVVKIVESAKTDKTKNMAWLNNAEREPN
jgi:hypothetical protein